MRTGRHAAAGLAATLIAAVAAAPASAVPDCVTPLPAAVAVLTGQGSLESVIVDGRGRLFYSDTTKGALMRLDAPGAQPAMVRGGIQAPGGLAFDADGRHLFVGQGDSLQGGLTGNLQPAASLLRVDVETGEASTFASGLRMANGLTRASDGRLYASSDLGLTLDEVLPDGTVRPDWAAVPSANGLALDRSETALFAAQTFVPAAITRIDRAVPSRTRPIFSAGGSDVTAGLDGMVMDAQERLVVAVNLFGEVWRVASDGSGTACALARGLANTSAVAYGHGPAGFSEGRLFAVGFDGRVVEVPAGRLPGASAPPALEDGPAPKVTLSPERVTVRGGRVRFVPKVRVGTRAVAATVRIGTRRLRTGRRAVLRVGARQTRLTARFGVAGTSYTRTIGLRR